MHAKEKLERLAETLVPIAMEHLGQAPGGRVVMAFLAPQLEGWVSRALDERTPEELDALIDQAIDFLGRLRSDERDPLRGSHLRDRGVGHGQIDPGAAAAAIGGGAPAGDRSE